MRRAVLAVVVALAVVLPSGTAYAQTTQKKKPDKAALQKGLQDVLKRDLNPLYRIHDVVLVDALPRTAADEVAAIEVAVHQRQRVGHQPAPAQQLAGYPGGKAQRPSRRSTSSRAATRPSALPAGSRRPSRSTRSGTSGASTAAP